MEEAGVCKLEEEDDDEEDHEEDQDQEQVCRTCLHHHDTSSSLYNIHEATDVDSKITLAEMIHDITAIKIESSDGYAQSICSKCVKEVKRAHKFRRKCLKSNRAIEKMKINKRTKPSVEFIKEIPILKEEPLDIEDMKIEIDVEDVLKTEYESDEESVRSASPIAEMENGDTREHNKDKKNTTFPKIIFDCPLCHGIFISDHIFQKHIKDLHRNLKEDKRLSGEFKTRGIITKRKVSKHKTQTYYSCAEDDFKGKTILELKNHLTIHMGEKPIVCTECNFRTTDIPLLKKHNLQRHEEEKRYSCPSCDYTCQTGNALRSHSAIHTNLRNFKCKLCSQTFKRASDLSVHKKVKHELRKSHVCPICQKAFFHSTALKEHAIIHTGEKPHVCHICGKAFTQRNNLNTHVHLRHEPATVIYKCDVCSYSTRTKGQYQVHMKRHGGEKDYQCHHCEFKTISAYTLKMHIMRHYGEKRFSCDLCDYKCMTPFNLKTHRRRHTGERPYHCDLCTYSARTHQGLQRHVQTHNSEQKHACPNCPFRTNIREILQRHLRKSCVMKKRGRPPSRPASIATTISEVPATNYRVKEESDKTTNTIQQPTLP